MSDFVTSELSPVSAPVATPGAASTAAPSGPKIRPAASLRKEMIDVGQVRRENRQQSFKKIAEKAILWITRNLNETLEAAIERAKKQRYTITSTVFYTFGFAEKGQESDARGNVVYFQHPDRDGSAGAETGSTDENPWGQISGLYLLDLVNPSREWHVEFFKMLNNHINEMAGGGNDYWTGHRYNTTGKFYEIFVSWGARSAGPSGHAASSPQMMRPPRPQQRSGHAGRGGGVPGPLVKRLPNDAPKVVDVPKPEGDIASPAPATAPDNLAGFPLLSSLMAGTSAVSPDDSKIAQTPRTVGPNKSQYVRTGAPKRIVTKKEEKKEEA